MPLSVSTTLAPLSMADTDRNLLFLGGLPDYISQDDVLRHLAVYGRITETKLRKGYGFVRFELEKDARDCVRMYTDRQFLGSNCSISIAKPFGFDKDGPDDRTPTTPRKSPSQAPKSLHQYSKRHDKIPKFPVIVEGLRSGIHWQELQHFGRDAGEILFVALDKFRSGRGYINYTSRQGAEDAVKKLNGKLLLGNVVSVAIHKGHVPFHRGRSFPPDRSARSRSRSPRKQSRVDLKRNDYRRLGDENCGADVKRETRNESATLKNTAQDKQDEGVAPSRDPFQYMQSNDQAREKPSGSLLSIIPALPNAQLPDQSAEDWLDENCSIER